MILIWLALASLGIAFVIGWLYVGRGVVRRLTGCRTAMKSVAAGKIGTDVATRGSDEIAEMADAVRFFKRNMIESNRLRSERAEAEKRVLVERKAEMGRIADEFESAVGEIVQTVSSADRAGSLGHDADANRRKDRSSCPASWKASGRTPRRCGRSRRRPRR